MGEHFLSKLSSYQVRWKHRKNVLVLHICYIDDKHRISTLQKSGHSRSKSAQYAHKDKRIILIWGVNGADSQSVTNLDCNYITSPSDRRGGAYKAVSPSPSLHPYLVYMLGQITATGTTFTFFQWLYGYLNVPLQRWRRQGQRLNVTD